MITAESTPSRRMDLSVSMPSIPGIQMSSRIAWKLRCLTISRHSSPVAASSTSNPSSERIAPMLLLTPCSSSTTRMRPDVMVSPAIGGWTDRLGRQVDHELRPFRLVVLDPDESVVVRDDPVDDGKPEAGSPLLGREVGNEE